MVQYRPMKQALLVSSLLLVPAWCQDGWVNDREVMQELRADGERYERDSAVLYFEKGQIPAEEMDAFSNLVEQGILDIEKLLKVPEEKTRARAGKLSYYVSTRIDIGRSRFRSIFLPAWRVQRKVAPYLHETTHALFRCSACPMWFSEGFASWVQSYVSENIGGYDAKVFARRGNAGVDADAARWLTTSQGQAVLPFVLEGGEPPDIAAERRTVGAPFYVLSQSLVKNLVERAGIDKIARLATAEDFSAELAKVTDQTPQDLKNAWLAGLRGVPVVTGQGPAGSR
jgi:hypothetical protein